MKPPPDHLLIRAAAGSGKTYRLVRRLIGLLADGAAPESVLAATFSRKAAGEFRTKLLRALATAVDAPSEAEKLADEIGRDDWDGARFRELLAGLVRDPEALRLSTIDAFFLELVGLFRLEFGLGSELSLAAETADEYELRELLRRIFSEAGDDVRQALFHLIEEDRSEDARRGFQTVVETWIENALALYRAAPDDSVWGRLPEGVPSEAVSPEEWKAAVRRFAAVIREEPPPPGWEEALPELIEAFDLWDFSPEPPRGTANWIKAGAVDTEKLLAGKKYFQPRGAKRLTVSEEAGRALVDLAQVFHRQVVYLAVQNTKSAHAFLRMYHGEYERRRLRRGRIRFADLPFLLRALGTVEGAVLSYRIDASIKHWLLDEFQDTSRGQWRVLEPFVEELFYDAEDRRSFFCVGDPKQAIYGWREGDSRLFEEIRRHYERFEPRPLKSESQSVTYRCAPAIVDFVNRMFGNAEGFPDEMDRGVATRWCEGWEDHRSARSDAPGRVTIRVAEDKESRSGDLVRFLEERKPWESGRKAAVLCRRNREANEIVALLRKNRIPTVRDGALQVAADFTVGRILHGIFRVLLHPGDGLALGFLRDAEAASAVETFLGGAISVERIRGKWERESPEAFLSELGRVLSEAGWMDASEQRCLRYVHTLVSGIRSTAQGSLSRLERAVAEARLEDAGAERSVQVLTIHRSKGLEFDMVLLPDLDGSGAGGGGRKFWTRSDPGGINAVLEAVKSETCEAFPPLGRWAEEEKRDSLFEDLCVHYVAFTRAVEELHLFLGPRKGTSKTGIHYWIGNALGIEGEDAGVVFEEGREAAPKTKETERVRPKEEPPPVSGAADTGPPPRLFAAGEEGDAGDFGSALFSSGRGERLQVGRRVHRLLAGMEWPSDQPFSRTEGEAGEILEQAMTSAEIRSLLSAPPGSKVSVWRERAFDALVEGAWVSGVFDRVHLPEDGPPVILDYKTDAEISGSIPEGHRHQMAIYRKALALILGKDPAEIEAKLVYLRAGIVVDV